MEVSGKVSFRARSSSPNTDNKGAPPLNPPPNTLIKAAVWNPRLLISLSKPLLITHPPFPVRARDGPHRARTEGDARDLLPEGGGKKWAAPWSWPFRTVKFRTGLSRLRSSQRNAPCIFYAAQRIKGNGMHQLTMAWNTSEWLKFRTGLLLFPLPPSDPSKMGAPFLASLMCPSGTESSSAHL